MPKAHEPQLTDLLAVAAATPAVTTRTLWFRTVAQQLGCKKDVVERLCREHDVTVPARQGHRTYTRGD